MYAFLIYLFIKILESSAREEERPKRKKKKKLLVKLWKTENEKKSRNETKKNIPESSARELIKKKDKEEG